MRMLSFCLLLLWQAGFLAVVIVTARQYCSTLGNEVRLDPISDLSWVPKRDGCVSLWDTACVKVAEHLSQPVLSCSLIRNAEKASAAAFAHSIYS